jgi:hypothetical protein
MQNVLDSKGRLHEDGYVCNASINGEPLMPSIYDETDAQLAEAVVLAFNDHKFRDLIEAKLNAFVRNEVTGEHPLTRRMTELQLGECLSEARPFDPTTTVARLTRELPIMRDQLRAFVLPFVMRAEKLTGFNLEANVGDCVMPNGACFVVCTVTRTT